MGDHYCCKTCHQRYDDCDCHKTVQTQPKPIESMQIQPTTTANNIKMSLEDVRYFHDKFQKYKDDKSANQLIESVREFMKVKGQ